MNLSLMGKVAWKVTIGANFPKVRIVKAKYLPNSTFLEDVNPRVGSAFWNGIHYTKVFLKNHIC